MHFNPYFSQVCSAAKIGIKMHALSLFFISAAVSVLFIAVHTNAENFKFFPELVDIGILVYSTFVY